MTPPMHPLLSVKDLCLEISGRTILEDISLDLNTGEFLGLIGPNGGGKTSLIRSILGLITPTRGQIQWTDHSPGRHPEIGYVPQRTLTEDNYPLTTLEIVLQGKSGAWPLWGKSLREARDQARKWIAHVGMEKEVQTPYSVLSGGQQRRVLLARALMCAPRALLLDEPTAGVDSVGQEMFCDLLRGISNQGIAVMLVSHDIPLISEYAQRIACLNVTLHWHGKASELNDQVVREAFHCELQRYHTSRHHHTDGSVHEHHSH